jgi:hypothetical protein
MRKILLAMAAPLPSFRQIDENESSIGTNDRLDYLLGSSWIICWLIAGLRRSLISRPAW